MKILPPAFVLFLMFFSASCAINPVSGQRELMLLSENEELQLGSRTDAQIVEEYGVYKDQKLSDYLQELGSRIGRLSHRPDLPYRVQVLDAQVVNAFAVPGGYIYFTRGILAYLNSEAELAAVLGHEMGHITARHSGQQYTRAQIAQIGLGIGMIFLDAFPSLSSLVEMGVGVLFLSYSRDNEREADRLGVEYAAKAGYDPGEMAEFFETLERMNPGTDKSGLPSWLSTHPNPEDRIGQVRSFSREWREKLNIPDAKVGREDYLKRIDGLLYGDDPRQGYVRDHVFYHPELRFQFPIPNGWKHTNTPSQMRVSSRSGDAAVVLTIADASAPKEAAATFISKVRPSVQSSEPLQVHGLEAHRLVSEVNTRNGILSVISYFIRMDKSLFVFHGLSGRGVFQRTRPVMEEVMSRFKRIADPKWLDVAPDRLRIRTVSSGSTLEEALLSMGVPARDLEETALLNGRSIRDKVRQNTPIKVIHRGMGG